MSVRLYVYDSFKETGVLFGKFIHETGAHQRSQSRISILGLMANSAFIVLYLPQVRSVAYCFAACSGFKSWQGQTATRALMFQELRLRSLLDKHAMLSRSIKTAAAAILSAPTPQQAKICASIPLNSCKDRKTIVSYVQVQSQRQEARKHLQAYFGKQRLLT